MIPVLLNNDTIKTVNGWFRSFICHCKRPRLKLGKLQLPPGQRGLTIPNIRLYQVASQFRYLVDWVRNDSDSVWLDIEAYNLGNLGLGHD